MNIRGKLKWNILLSQYDKAINKYEKAVERGDEQKINSAAFEVAKIDYRINSETKIANSRPIDLLKTDHLNITKYTDKRNKLMDRYLNIDNFLIKLIDCGEIRATTASSYYAKLDPEVNKIVKLMEEKGKDQKEEEEFWNPVNKSLNQTVNVSYA